MRSLVVLDQLEKSFGRMRAVDRVSLELPPGEIFGFLGANGAGKTTTIRMLCGLTRPDGGRASIAGLDVWAQRSEARKLFGYMPQKFSLYPDLSVLENLRFFAGACRVPAAEAPARIEALIERADLRAKRDALAGSLSGGMKQLLALACALVHEPKLLFLDEPTAGLDPVHRQQMWDLLYELSHGGVAVFVTTHYMDEAERCTQLGFIHRGRLLAQAPPDRLKSSFRAKLLELEVDPVMPALLRLRAESGVLGAALRSGRVRLYAPDPEALLARWTQAWPHADLRLLGHRWAEPDMEDVFTAYSQGYDALLDRA
ncbi:MAG: ABC transporter ATP-binding protein [Verrucomicrobia bacterium]|nr:ABC transporter ATP-binding protein [Verrucomicrobiota bacterium]